MYPLNMGGIPVGASEKGHWSFLLQFPVRKGKKPNMVETNEVILSGTVRTQMQAAK